MTQENRKLLGPEAGQTMAEYVVVLGVITLAIVTSFGLMSGGIENVLSQVVGHFS